MEPPGDICRICLDPNAFVSLLAYDTFDEKNRTKLCHKLFACTAVQISLDDSLPKSICDACASKLEDAHRLRELAQEGDNILRAQNGLVKIEYFNVRCDFDNWLKSDPTQAVSADTLPVHSEDDTVATDSYYLSSELLTIKEEPDLEIGSMKKMQKNKNTKMKNTLDKYRDVKNKKGRLKQSKPAKMSQKTKSLNVKTEINKLKLKLENNNKDLTIFPTPWTDIKKDEYDILNSSHEVLFDEQSPPANRVKLEENDCEDSNADGLEELDDDFGKVEKCKQIKKPPREKFQEQKCTMCSHVFRHRDLFQRHMRVDHQVKGYARAKEYMCDVCGNTFHDPYGLRMHKRSHSGDRPFTCNVCGQGFTQQSNMERHISARHRKDKPFQCEQCSKHFAYASTLREHTRAHKGEQHHVCNICGRRFSRRYALVRHQLTHTHARPYACRHCGRTYTQTNDLKAHVKRTHTDAPTDKLADYCIKQSKE